MNTTPRIIEGQYFQDLMAQPQALRATLAWLSRWRSLGGGAQFRRLPFLAADRADRHGLLVPHAASHQSGPDRGRTQSGHDGDLRAGPLRAAAAAMNRPWWSPSRSPAAVPKRSDCWKLERRAPVLGVTNTAGSALAQRADLALLTQAGPEFSVSCKTYVGEHADAPVAGGAAVRSRRGAVRGAA